MTRTDITQLAPLGSWAERAACRTHPHLAWWHSSDPEETTAAVHVCHACPVTAPCLEHAREQGEQHGVWGGQVFSEHRETSLTQRILAAARDGMDIPEIATLTGAHRRTVSWALSSERRRLRAHGEPIPAWLAPRWRGAHIEPGEPADA